MSLLKQLNTLLDPLLTASSSTVSKELLVSCIDLTLLKENEPTESFITLKQQAQFYQVAAVCVFYPYLPLFHPPINFRLATVINFPSGQEEVKKCLSDLEQAISLGAQEIDYVFPYQAYISGHAAQTIQHCEMIARYCQEHQRTLKVIVETGAFTELHQIHQVGLKLIDLGVDFLKTSTGTINQGASLAAVFALLSAIKDSNSICGIKVSGGVKTKNQALRYAHLASLILEKDIHKDWFRIGASSLLNELVKK